MGEAISSSGFMPTHDDDKVQYLQLLVWFLVRISLADFSVFFYLHNICVFNSTNYIHFPSGYEACKRRIFTLSLPNEPSPCTEEERIMFLRTVIDFNHVQTVHALGALLRYLDLNWANLSMNMQSKPQFLSLRIISL